MLNYFRKFFSPPVFEDEDKTRIARYFNSITLSAAFALAAIIALRLSSGAVLFDSINSILLVLIVFMLGARYLVARGYVKFTSHILVGLAWVSLAYLAWEADGIRDSTYYALIVIILMASLLLGTRAMFAYTVATILLGIWFSSLEASGSVQFVRETSPIFFARDLTFIFALVGIFIYLVTSSLNNALANARQSARDFQNSNEELRSLQNELENRVENRTAELEIANQQVQHRAEQFKAIAQVSQIISSIGNQEELLQRVTHTISQQFGFYHVGIFLMSKNKQFAVLRAANSEGGQRMLKREHRLGVGQTGIVGFVTSTGRPRIALDTGTDAVYFDNPDLPETRSEIALPLMIDNKVVGALDVQSTKPNAFLQEDINTLSVLTDQVSAALKNARLHEEANEALSKAEAAYRQVTGEAWSGIRRLTPVFGYHFDGNTAEPLDMPVNGGQIESQNDALYTVPVQLRGASIGKLRIKPTNDGHQWTEDEIAIIQATAERVALAVENARLILDSQKRASKEQVIGEISSKIGSSINLDNIMQTTLREMGRILPGAEISIQVENK